MRRFRVLGTTDSAAGCDCCGRRNLKRYVALLDLEAGDVLFYGTGCAARAEGLPASRITSEAKAADALRVAALRAVARFAAGAAEAIYRQWAIAQGATVDRFGNVTPPAGMTPWELRKAYRSAP